MGNYKPWGHDSIVTINNQLRIELPYTDLSKSKTLFYNHAGVITARSLVNPQDNTSYVVPTGKIFQCIALIVHHEGSATSANFYEGDTEDGTDRQFFVCNWRQGRAIDTFWCNRTLAAGDYLTFNPTDTNIYFTQAMGVEVDA